MLLTRATRRIPGALWLSCLPLCLAACGNATPVFDGIFGTSLDSGVPKDTGKPSRLKTGDATVDGGACTSSGETRACYDGPAGTLGVGGCKAGVQTCQAIEEAQFAYGPCEGETLPGATNGWCVTDARVPLDATIPVDAKVPVEAGPVPRFPADAGPFTTLFGGNEWGVSDLSDTWIWNGTTWTETNATGPSERSDTMLAPLGGKLVLFGGQGDSDAGFGKFESDTWTWDRGVWQQVATTGPSSRAGASMASLAATVVLFGGHQDGYDGMSDTWTWDGTSWQQQNGAGPSERWWAVMAPLNGTLTLFGGAADVSGPQDQLLDDTWTWDGSTWTELSVAGPPARSLAVMAPLGDKLVLFGGVGGNGDGVLGDTWTWDGTSWTELQVDGPPARFAAAMAPLGDKLVLFGGETAANSATLGDTWIWDGSAWTQADATGPVARWHAIMATP
jgi:N-acetylneuraminic acid mutarotase